MKRFSLLILIGYLGMMAPSHLQGQEQFERLYPSSGDDDRSFFTNDIAVSPGGAYFFLSTVFIPDSMENDRVNVTKLDKKGSLVWSRDFSVGDGDYQGGSLQLLEGDSFLIHFSYKNEDEDQPTEVLLLGAGDEDPIWSFAYGGVEDELVGENTVFRNFDGRFVMAGNNAPASSEDQWYVAAVDENGDLLWGNAFNTAPGAPVVRDIQQTPDSGYIVCGTLAIPPLNTQIFLAKLDTLGELEWSRLYRQQAPPFVENQNAYAIQVAPDSGYFVVGDVQGGFLPSGLLLRTDKEGDILQAWRTDNLDNGGNEVAFRDLVFESNSLTISGTSKISLALQPFAVNLSNIDIVDWASVQKIYTLPNNASLDQQGAQLAANPTTGGVILGNNYIRSGEEEVLPYLSKLDFNGETLCNDPLGFDIVDLDGFFTVDTLIFFTEPFDQQLALTDTSFAYEDFDIPVLSLQGPGPFCVGEPIQGFFEASVNASPVTYEWGDGSTNDSLFVDMEGSYPVTVTVLDEFCYTLCDTGTIAIIGPPQPVADILVDSLCTAGFTTLAVNAPGATSLEWLPGGQTTPAIDVTAAGIYSVTAANQCGSNSTQVTVEESPPAATLFTQGNVCLLGEQQVLVAASNFTDLQWNTGETNDTILVNTPGVYSVTVDNLCESITEEITVEEQPPFFNPNDAFLVDSNVCSDPEALITVVAENLTGLFWNTGATTTTISVMEPGTYTANIYNLCDTVSASTTLNPVPPFGTIAGVDADSFCANGSYQLSPGTLDNATGFSWNTGSTNDMISVDTPGTYQLIGFNFCFEEGTVIDEVVLGPEDFVVEDLCGVCVEMPNVFTPNNDQLNRTLRPVIPCPLIENYNLKIYSRWGEIVFESNDETQGWDGTFNGEALPMDVYVWMVTYEESGVARRRYGDVTLIR